MTPPTPPLPKQRAKERKITTAGLEPFSKPAVPLCIVCRKRPQKLQVGRYARVCSLCAEQRKDHVWMAADSLSLDEIVRTGYLPDGRIATQQRVADYLGFCRLTIVAKLAGRRFPRVGEVMAEAGRRGGLGGYQRRIARLHTIRLNKRD